MCVAWAGVWLRTYGGRSVADFLEEIDAILAANSSKAGAGTSYPTYLGHLPDSTVIGDRAVGLLLAEGFPDGERTGVENPGLQVLVRGTSLRTESSAYAEASATAKAVKDALAGYSGDLTDLDFFEQFEATGYDETWSEGETVTNGNGTIPTIDSDSTGPTPRPDGWGDLSLEIVAVGDAPSTGPGTIVAEVEHQGLADHDRYRFEFGFLFDGATLADGDQLGVARLRTSSSAQIAKFWFRDPIASEPGSTGPALFAEIYHDGSRNKYAVNVSSGEVYRSDLQWDIEHGLWSWSVNGSVIASGPLSGEALSTPYRVNTVALGVPGNDADIPATYYLDNVRVRSYRHYAGLWAESGPAFIGFDESKRPLFSTNFRAMRSRR